MSLQNIRSSNGLAYVGPVATVPLGYLQTLQPAFPIPITISGTNDVTFTVNGSTTAPVKLLVGNDYIEIDNATAATYTWVSGTNTILASTGATASLTGSTLGVWYFYVGLNSSGALLIYPSQTAPIRTPSPFGHFGWSHPGTSKTISWSYVGAHVCTTAATPVFRAMEKIGWWYEFAAVTVATTTTWALLDLSASLPAHPVELKGYLKTSTTDNDTTEIGSSSTDLRGVLQVTNHTAEALMVPFAGGVTALSSGKIYGSSTTAAGEVGLTGFKDVV